MSEFIYAINQKTGRAPVIRKLGAIKLGMEQTPVIFKGVPVIVESMTPDSICNHQYIRCRNLATDEISDPFGIEYYFVSAFVDGDVLCAFATSRHDDKPLTMYQNEVEQEWHDPRGGHNVRMFRTTDLKHWEEKDVISCPDRRLWNTSVCKGDGKYVMAIEVSHEEGFDIPQIGHQFTCFFAESTDLDHWTMMDDDKSYTAKRYNACPALRYANGWYYMICLEEFPCKRYASYIYRTQNFSHWEVGFHNPIMMWSDEDRIPKAGCSFTPEELELLETGLNINCSDIDFFEYEGKTHIYYASGDQMTYSFLCEAVYDGPIDQFWCRFLNDDMQKRPVC